MEDVAAIKELITALGGAGGGGAIVIVGIDIGGKKENRRGRKNKSKSESTPVPDPQDAEMHKTHTEIFLRLKDIEVAIPTFVRKGDLDRMKDTLTAEIRQIGRELRSDIQGFVRKEDLSDKIKVIGNDMITTHSATCQNRKGSI